MDYWSYYDNDFSWCDESSFLRPSFEKTRNTFINSGIAPAKAEALIRSGYVCLLDGQVVDRFYGGALNSIDFRTRFGIDRFLETLERGQSPVEVVSADSIDELRATISNWRLRYNRPLIFRGQTTSYELKREIPNPHFVVPGMGEISLLPSLWRNMWQVNPMSFHHFCGLSTLDWSLVLSSQFDMQEIDARVLASNEAGNWILSAQDMEDSDDPLLSAFGKHRLDLMMGNGLNLSDPLNTLVQHYGMHSPVLDLTADLDISIFFATNRFRKENHVSRYEWVGTNDRKSLVYVFRENPVEMATYEDDRVLGTLKPLRPVRQACRICRSGPFALNLAADFLIGVVKLDFDEAPCGKYKTADLFPCAVEDNFLAALKKHLRRPELVTSFG